MVTIWLLSAYYLVTIWLLSAYYLATICLLSAYYVVTICILSAYYLVTIWLLSGYSLHYCLYKILKQCQHRLPDLRMSILLDEHLVKSRCLSCSLTCQSNSNRSSIRPSPLVVNPYYSLPSCPITASSTQNSSRKFCTSKKKIQYCDRENDLISCLAHQPLLRIVSITYSVLK